MKAIQIKSIVWILGLLLSVSNVAGQRVITNHPSANGYPVIDLSELSPLGCVLTPAEAAERRTLMNAQTPSNSEFLGVGSSVSDSNGTWNVKMSSLYQVMRDVHTVGYVDWENAHRVCKQYEGEGGASGQWRLPTQRELMVIWGLYPQLKGKGGFVTNAAFTHLWSLTDCNSLTAWHIRLPDGFIGNQKKATAACVVRCVRDLD